MTYNILAGQLAEPDIINLLQNLHGHIKAWRRIFRKVFLGSIACDDNLGPKTDSCQEHLHLCRSGILCFIQNDKCIIQSTTSHIGKRSNLDQAFFHIFCKAVCPHDLIKCIIQGTKIRIDLTLEISRKKSQFLAGFNGRSGKNNPGNFFIAECGYCHSHGKICLTGSCRPHSKYDHLLTDLFHIILLSKCLGFNGSSLYGITDKVLVDFLHHGTDLLHGKRKCIIHILLCDGIASARKGIQFLHDRLRLCSSLLASQDFKRTIPEDHGYVQSSFDQLQMLVKLSENIRLAVCRHIHI